MNFPMNNPLFHFLYLLVNNPGLGGMVVVLLGGGSVLAYALALRWIARGGEVEEKDTYAYPTLAFHHSERPAGPADQGDRLNR